MKKVLLIDFGASRIKSAVCDLKTGRYFNYLSQSSVYPKILDNVYFEVPISSISKKFLEICSFYSKHHIEAIAICSEMHGFSVFSPKCGFKTGYISWKDDRGNILIKGKSSIDIISEGIGEKFRSITGMKIKSGLPYVNLFYLGLKNKIQNGDMVLTLPESILVYSGKLNEKKPFSHYTLSAGLGFYDIYKKQISTELMDFFCKETKKNIILGEYRDSGIVGYISIDSKRVPVLPATGDMQTAILGAGNTKKTISINIGTGSQVSIISDLVKSKTNEQRPFFDNYILDTITHIPAGRALNEYLNFINKISEKFGANNVNVWDFVRTIKMKDLLNSSLVFNLGIFPGAFRSTGTGSITAIKEGSLTIENYVSSLLKSMALQYVEAINNINPKGREKIIISGGIPRKIPVLSKAISFYSNFKVEYPLEKEETISGLRVFSSLFLGY